MGGDQHFMKHLGGRERSDSRASAGGREETQGWTGLACRQKDARPNVGTALGAEATEHAGMRQRGAGGCTPQSDLTWAECLRHPILTYLKDQLLRRELLGK